MSPVQHNGLLIIKPGLDSGEGHADRRAHSVPGRDATFSLILFAITDANYRFFCCHFGSPGSCNDAAIWSCCNLKKLVDDNNLGLPNDSSERVKYHLVGDDIFPLHERLLKPFP